MSGCRGGWVGKGDVWVDGWVGARRDGWVGGGMSGWIGGRMGGRGGPTYRFLLIRRFLGKPSLRRFSSSGGFHRNPRVQIGGKASEFDFVFFAMLWKLHFDAFQLSGGSH